MPIRISGSTGVSGLDGTAAAPSTQGANTSAGLFFPTINTVAIATNGTEAMRIDSSGNMGIGTNTPGTTRLNIYDASNNPFTTLINSGQTGTTIRSNSLLRLQTNATGRDVNIQFSDNISNSAEVGMLSGAIYFTSNGTERMRIDSSGNVGIGSATPGSKLSIFGGSLTSTGQYALSFAAGLTTGRAGTYDAGTLSSIHTYFDNSSVELTAGSSNGYVAGISITGNNSSLYTGAIRFVTASVERARIAPDGTFTNGSATFSNTSGSSRWATYRFEISAPNTTAATDMMYFRNTNGIVGAVGTTGSSTYYNTSSDYRLKENVQPMIGALAKVALLKPVTFKWKSDNTDGQGFIAHELQAVIPDAVTGTKDAVDDEGNPHYQGVDASFLVATLTAAIQELKAEFDAYKASHP